MQITVTDTPTYLPEAIGRKQLILRNTGSNTVYYGWESTVSATAGASQGVPLKADEPLSFAGRDLDLSGRLYLVCASGQTTTINYTQRS